jgi:surface antigen
MGFVAKVCGVLAMLPVLMGEARAERHFYYGADCALENTSNAEVVAALDGIVLEGRSGAVIARDLVCADRPPAFHALALAFRRSIGNPYVWSNGTSRGLIRATWEFRDRGLRCRDFALDHTVNGHRYLRQGTACLEPDGNWHLH